MATEDAETRGINRLRPASYGVLIVSLAVGIAALRVSVLTGLMAAALIFGWAQVGGL